MNRLFRSAFIPLIAIVLVIWLASNTLMSKATPTVPQLETYSGLVTDANSGGKTPDLYLVKFNPSKRAVAVTIDSSKGAVVTLYYPSDQAALELQNTLQKDGVPYDSDGTGGLALPLFNVDAIDPFGRIRQARIGLPAFSGPASYSASYADTGRRLLQGVKVSSAMGAASREFPISPSRGR